MSFLTHGRLYCWADDEMWSFGNSPTGHERPFVLTDLYPELEDGEEHFEWKDTDAMRIEEDHLSVFADPLPIERISRLSPKRKKA